MENSWVNLQYGGYYKSHHTLHLLPHYLVNVRKQATNDKLQGLVATYLRCGGVVNNQINNDLLLSLSVKKYLKSVNIWQSCTQERGCPVHYVRLCTAKSAHETTMFLLVTLPNIH